MLLALAGNQPLEGRLITQRNSQPDTWNLVERTFRWDVEMIVAFGTRIASMRIYPNGTE